MKYHIWTSGCQMNVADSQRLASALERLGYLQAQSAEGADVIVLNTCVVRQSAEDRAYGYLQSLKPLKRDNPQLVINLMGCLVGVRNHNKLEKKLPFVDVFSPPSDPEPLLDYLRRRDGKQVVKDETSRMHQLLDGDLVLPEAAQGCSFTAYVPVVYGCSHACTFCVIPHKRGPERSRPLSEIVKEVQALAGQGIREVTLLGQIVDRYGLDLPGRPALSVLLREIHQVDGIQRIRFLTSHPNWMDQRLLQTVADLEKVCEHIEIPVQAGDDEILERMRRGYTVAEYRQLIDIVRAYLPNGSIATDIIVGFSGETTAQFEKTYRLLEELRLDVAHLARYSPRPGTLAMRKLQDDVPQGEKMRRFRALEELQAGISHEINASHLGQEVEILVEGRHKNRWMGRTRTNKLVFFESPSYYAGELVRVQVEHNGSWSMNGSLIEKNLIQAAP
jgi:tRNA-2-methylthio-N6-dimethylallyladenosine synthase